MGKRIADGVGIIQDTTEPTTLHIRRHNFSNGQSSYTLADELMESGTIPLSGSTHLCSVHFKAEVLDPLIYWALGDTRQPITHSFGYNRDETGRIKNSETAFASDKSAFTLSFGYNANETGRIKRATEFDHLTRKGIYPLQVFDLTREECIEFLTDCFDAIPQKSACTGCPFSRPTIENLTRKLEDIELAAEDLLIEYAALCMNWNNSLYPGKTLLSLIEQANLESITSAYHQLLRNTPLALYRVRRIYTAKGVPPARATQIITTGEHQILERQLQSIEGDRQTQNGITYVIQRHKEEIYPTSTEHHVIAPAFIEAKVRGKWEDFERRWDEVINGKRQKSLFEAASN